MKNQTYVERIELEEGDLTLSVQFTVYEGIKGSRDSLGVPIEPDDSDELVIENITPATKAEIAYLLAS